MRCDTNSTSKSDTMKIFIRKKHKTKLAQSQNIRIIDTLLYVVFNLEPLPFVVIINRPPRPEGPMRCPGRGNEGGLFVFFATFGYHLCADTIVTTCYYRLLQVTHVTTGY